MIRFFDEKDKSSVISIWKEAFGDGEEEINLFLSFLKNDMLVYEKDGKAISMLTLLKVRIGEEIGRYVYAVATDKEFRNRGYAGKLIEYAKHFITENNERFLVLLPQEEYLYSFYKKFGFCSLCCAEKISGFFDYNENIAKRAEMISIEEYFLFRKSYFKNDKFVIWDIKTLEFMKGAYGGDFLIIKEENEICGGAFCYKQEDSLAVAELLSIGNVTENIKSLGAFYKINNVNCICAKKDGEKFAMIYPCEYSDSYFGLGMK